LFSAVLIFELKDFPFIEGEFHTVTFIANIFPLSWIESAVLYQSFLGLFALSLLFWIFRIAPRAASVFCAGSFFLAVSMYMQNSSFPDHRNDLFCILLILLSAREFQLFPRLFFPMASVFTCLTYFLAGFEKILASGLGWVNGVGLQVYANVYGMPSSLLRSWILENKMFAQGLQATVLILELGIFSLYGPSWLRRIWLVGLLGFSLGIEEMFGFKYIFHYATLCLLFIDFDPMMWIKDKSVLVFNKFKQKHLG
jgi:hypothetical protein